MSVVERASGEEQGDEIEISAILRFLRRRLPIILSIAILVAGLTALIVHQLVPRYTADTILAIDYRSQNVANVEAVLSGMSTEGAAIATELDIIRSPALMQRVVDRLDLYEHPVVNPTPQKGTWQQATEWFGSLLPEEFGIADEPESEDAAEATSVDPETHRKRIVGRLRGGLEVEHVRGSYTIRISYTSTDREFAALIANAVAEQYLVDQLEARFEATRRANAWLTERLEDLREEVRIAELAVRDYREANNIVENQGTTVSEQQLAQINAELVVAQVERSQAESRLRAARNGSPEGLRDVEGATFLRDLRSELSSLRRRETELSNRYGPRHPEMVNVRSEREDLQARLSEETRRVVQTLVNEVEVAEAKEQALRDALADLRGATAGGQRAEVELNELVRQAEAARTLYENFLSRYRETSDQPDIDRADARVITEASVPGGPSFPKSDLMMAGGAVLGLLLGVTIAVLIELLDRGFRRSEQLEKAAGVPVLGIAPLLKGKVAPSEYLLAKPFSAFAEALRTLRTALQFTNVDNPHKVVMITSSVPKEGKSTISFSLARLTAKSGARTLIIEADMRRPSLAKAAGVRPHGFLSDVLVGEVEWQDAIVVDERSGAHLLAAKGGVASPAELLASKRMASFLEAMKQQYDLVIVDTPPVMAVSDAAVLAKIVDATVFVVRWAETPRETVKTALHQLENMDVKVTGLVMSQVDLKRQAAYGYGDYGYYYGRYKEYYAE